jgi:hypothetical protein
VAPTPEQEEVEEVKSSDDSALGSHSESAEVARLQHMDPACCHHLGALKSPWLCLVRSPGRVHGGAFWLGLAGREAAEGIIVGTHALWQPGRKIRVFVQKPRLLYFLLHF